MLFKQTLVAITIAASLTACGTMNNYLAEKRISVEYYRVYDIQTKATRQQIAKAASNGLGKNVNGAQEAMPIVTSGDLPEKPGRIDLVDPFANGNMAGLAAFAGGAGAISIKIAKCNGAVWTSHAVRNISGSNNLNIYACLYQYKSGFQLNEYAVFTKAEGGLMQISRDMANSMVGTPEEWTEKTLLDVVRNIGTTTNSKISLVDAQPEIAGTPWLDR